MKKRFVGYSAVLGLCALSAAAATIALPPGGDFQAALNSARAGDVITLAAGSIYKGPFVLPANSGPAYITIRTSAADSSLPASGARMTPAYGSLLPKVVSDGSAGLPVIRTTQSSSHYQFIGLEITPTKGAFVLQLVQLGDGNETSLSQLPNDFVFDRCYLHGDPTVGARRGVAMNAPNITIINSYLSDFKLVGPDSQALASWNGPGPLNITNNYLEGAGENVLIGGQDPTIPNLVPTGITIRHNYFSKPLSWRVGDPAYQGTHWTVKNLLEFKNARQIVVDGNSFENNWADAQAGFAILFTPRNQDGTAPWSVVADVAFTNNTVRHVASGINILGTDDIYVSQQLHNVAIKNNLFEDITTQWGGTARSFQVLNSALNVTFDHNTAFAAGAILVADQLPSPGLRFTNNLATHGAYGIFGSGLSEGMSTLAGYFPNAVFERNSIIGGNAAFYPTGEFFPADINDVGFLDSGAGNYQLLGSSLLHNAGTDGADIGVNVSQLNAHLSLAEVQVFGPSALTVSHIGNFAQGEPAATYSISVQNISSTASSGNVSVTDTLPAGLTPTAIVGAGWTCTLSTVTCSRSDALAPGASFPPIRITVSVASNAPSLVNNQASVSGGLATATASDATTITAAFADVSTSDLFLPAIDLLSEYGITSGCGANPPQYCENQNVTEGQMAVFVVRSVMGGDNFSYTQTPYFSDVPASYIFFKWIQKMQDLGIALPCAPNQFCPEAPVTRGIMAVLIIRSRYGVPTPSSYPAAPYFSDVPTTHHYFPWIQKMEQLGITSGCAPSSYCPNDPVTRGQMAVFIMRGESNLLLPATTPVVVWTSPASISEGQSASVRIIGQSTNFIGGMTQVNAGAGIIVSNISVSSGTTLTAQFTVASGATLGPRSITVTTGSEEATLPNGFRVQ